NDEAGTVAHRYVHGRRFGYCGCHLNISRVPKLLRESSPVRRGVIVVDPQSTRRLQSVG
ncbi:MAG: hypothetical protein ACJATT_004946, partial [Myxococcota bacterium]